MGGGLKLFGGLNFREKLRRRKLGLAKTFPFLQASSICNLSRDCCRQLQKSTTSPIMHFSLLALGALVASVNAFRDTAPFFYYSTEGYVPLIIPPSTTCHHD
jgi:hypothetical protein